MISLGLVVFVLFLLLIDHKLSRPIFVIAGGATVRLGDMIRPFDGKEDVVGFLTKARLVAKLQNIEKLESFLPLFLEGAALAQYLEMDPGDQGDVGKIEEKL